MDESSHEVEIDPEDLKVFREMKAEIITLAVERSLLREEEIRHHGKNARQIIAEGFDFTFKMLDAAMAVGELSILEDQLSWALKRLPHDNVNPVFILNRFELFYDVVDEVMPAEKSTGVKHYIRWMIERMHELLPNTDQPPK
ncbi:MAG: hypothetical protein U5P10_00235 [Spirochaetia bacterium]|nr:hypothetical protein [Spirochaetia bacterium]